MAVVGQRDHARDCQRERSAGIRAGVRQRVAIQRLRLGECFRRVGTIEREVVLEVVQILLLRRGDILRRWVVRLWCVRVELLEEDQRQEAKHYRQCRTDANDPQTNFVPAFHLISPAIALRHVTAGSRSDYTDRPKRIARACGSARPTG